MPQPLTSRLILNAAALAAASPTLLFSDWSKVALGNAYATQEGWSVAGKECYESRTDACNRTCLHRGGQSSSPKFRVHVGIPEFNMKVQRWMQEQTRISKECANLIHGLVSMIPEWWSGCQVRMRWEILEQGKRLKENFHNSSTTFKNNASHTLRNSPWELSDTRGSKTGREKDGGWSPSIVAKPPRLSLM
jgi:hypothetical protein